MAQVQVNQRRRPYATRDLREIGRPTEIQSRDRSPPRDGGRQSIYLGVAAKDELWLPAGVGILRQVTDQVLDINLGSADLAAVRDDEDTTPVPSSSARFRFSLL